MYKANLSETLNECPSLGCDGTLKYTTRTKTQTDEDKYNKILPVLRLTLTCPECQTEVTHVSQYMHSEASKP